MLTSLPQTGWICPICGIGVAPWMPTCPCKQVASDNREMRAERTLAALREPSEEVIDAAANAPHEHRHPDVPTLAEQIRAAVEAAEKEVTDANR